MAYAWWNPLVWAVFFGMVGLTALAVRVFHDRYPYFAIHSQKESRPRVPLPVVASDASLDLIWQTLFRSGSEAVMLVRPDGSSTGIVTLEEALEDVDWTLNPKLKEAVSD